MLYYRKNTEIYINEDLEISFDESDKEISDKESFNLFVPNTPFLYPWGRERVHWEQIV